MTAIVAVVLVGVALAIISRPLLTRSAGGVRVRGAGGLAELEERYRNALADIQDAQNDWEIGNLSEADYTRFREDGRRRAAEALREISVYAEQRERLRSEVEREIGTLTAPRNEAAPEDSRALSNGHARLASPPPPPRAAQRPPRRVPAAYFFGGTAVTVLAVVGIVVLYTRQMNVQGAQAPVGAVPTPLPRSALVDAGGGFWAAKPDGLAQSADGHAWKLVASDTDVTAIAARDGRPWLAIGSKGAVLSNDGGSTWVTAPAPPAGDVAGAQSGPDAVYAYFNSLGLVRTSDGESWQQVADPVTTRVTSFAIAPGSQGGQVLYLVAGGQIIRSGDGGRTWLSASGAVNLAVTGVVRGIAADPISGALFAASSDGIFKTTRDGNDWDKLPFRGGVIAVAARGDRMIAIDESGHVFVSNSGGVAWTADQ